MRIQGQPPQPSTAAAHTHHSRHVADGDADAAKTASSTAGSGDAAKVTVSSEARALAEKASAASAARIEGLRQAVASNTLAIDPQRIADRLVNG